MDEYLVRDIMSTGPITCRLDSSLKEVTRLMAGAEVSALVVVDEVGGLAGVISGFDLLDCYNADLGAVRARDLMHKQVVTIRSTDIVQRAVSLMKEHHIHRVVVVDGNRPIHPLGVISVTDVVKHMWRMP
jgi:CBS domain-containing protein